jgi:hypothetical protein
MAVRVGAELTLLYRAYCHLCDDLLAALRPLAAAHRCGITVIDVDAPEHALLEARWGDRVPVLFLGTPADGRELCHYQLDHARVESALRASAADDRVC